jgi:hypothetical protein
VVPNTSARSSSKVPENPLVTSCPAKSGRTKRSAKDVCCGAQVTLPGPVTDGVRAGRPETGAAPDKHAVSENEDATVSTLDAVEHVDVNRVNSKTPKLTAPLVARYVALRLSFVIVGATE